ncbi:hypothetical protein HanRHA438_Chr09g0382921 [Helianthus annuus]|nr:hypothetical protein HanIR_Chr09g0400571 [Helianthus annuus]KAJ0886739.1 hypothetical protein HanRHA438_Chr09g0382921 [Helianthus annuus]
MNPHKAQGFGLLNDHPPSGLFLIRNDFVSHHPNTPQAGKNNRMRSRALLLSTLHKSIHPQKFL